MKYKKDVIEEQFFDLLPKYNGKKLAFLLIFYFIYVNWAPLKDIKNTSHLINLSQVFSAKASSEVFSDRCKLIGKRAHILLQQIISKLL